MAALNGALEPLRGHFERTVAIARSRPSVLALLGAARNARRRACRYASAGATVAIVLLGAGCASDSPPGRFASDGEVGIVVDARLLDDVRVDIWRRAAHEQGLAAGVISDRQLERALQRGAPRFVALVLPDGLIREASDALVAVLQRYVDDGGELLVAFDAATLTPQGRYALPRARLSALVGVDYALYDALRERTFRRGPVYATRGTAARLGVPPGKSVVDASRSARTPFDQRLSTYAYDPLQYASFATAGPFDGEALLESADGQLVAGLHRYGRGRVLFANVALGGLKLGTDGWLLGRFLRLLAIDAGLPKLAMTPNGVGGLVMNLHCDSSAALGPLLDLDRRGFFDDGPYSIHVTAGPGLERADDGLGIDVPHNAAFQMLLRSWATRGHEIGSHGGWIHNYWAAHAGPATAADDARLLELNGAALAAATGVPVRVYSAPSGNHPPWVTRWLRQHGYRAYYTTANGGSAPTRTFRDGVLEDLSIWSFPIATLGTAASFEEAADAGLDENRDVAPWLESLTRFVADEKEVRLVYFHPTGVHLYAHALAAWVGQAHALARERRFRWYTMAGLAEFLDRREAVEWSVARSVSDDRITAAHPTTLAAMTWTLPASIYDEPRVRDGAATVRRVGDDWLVSAGEGRELAFDATRHAAR